jgi:acetyltransferase-like isoleucine patch superfamily enzyme
MPFVNHFFFQWKLARVPFSILLVNFIFQRIFRINSKVSFPVHYTSRIIGFNNIKLNRDSNTVGSFCLSNNSYIQALQGIEIGANFLFAPGTTIISVNHGVNNEYKDNKTKPVIIGDNVWLGANVTILPEVELGDNVVVGAGSVVTKSFPANSIIAGNPAKLIKSTFDV